MKNKQLATAYHAVEHVVYLLSLGIMPASMEIHASGGNITTAKEIKDDFVNGLIALIGTVS